MGPEDGGSAGGGIAMDDHRMGKGESSPKCAIGKTSEAIGTYWVRK